MFTLPTDLSQFITFMATPTFVSWLFSDLLEQLPAFHKLQSGQKTVLWLAVSILLGLLSFALVQWTPAGAVAQLQPIYAIIIGSITAYLSGSFYHAKIDNTTDNKSVG